MRSRAIALTLLAGAACTSSKGGGPASGTGGVGGATVVTDGGGTDVVDASNPDVPSTPPFTPTFHLGADITWVPHDEYYGATYVDTDGVQKDILALMKNHGMNSVRLRTFVDPRAADGYDQFDGFGDIAHTDDGPAGETGRHGPADRDALQR